MALNARTPTLRDLRRDLGLHPDPDDTFFRDWLDRFSPLTDTEKLGLERLACNYDYLSQEEPPLEEVIKPVVISPLLDLAGFYRSPFSIKTEVGTTLIIADEPDREPIQGKIDILVVQESLWILVIESKPARVDVTAGIPQALTYLFSAPIEQQTVYGTVTNGREMIFLKLNRDKSFPRYSRSFTYRLLESEREREEVLQGLKYLGSLIRQR